MTRAAEFAVPARDRRLERDSLAGTNTLHALTHRDDLPGRLMTEYLRVDGGHRADAAFLIPVHIAAADPDRAKANEHFIGLWIGRHGHPAGFQYSGRYELDGVHQDE